MARITLYSLIIPILFLIAGNHDVQAQNVGLQIPKKLSGSSWTISLLHKPDSELRFDLSANLAGQGAELKIGRTANRYDVVSVPVTGNTVQFRPSDFGLSPGRYFVRVTNSAAETTNQIISDTREGLLFSNEVVLAVEAPNAATVLAPRGTITSGAPLFEWTEVPGVVAYWIIFSSTPFEIKSDENDDISIEGANLVWQNITTETSTLYGSIDADIGSQPDAPPLDPGREYSYTVLNMYDESSPAFASAVFGGVIPMVYENPNALPKATLLEPADALDINAVETVTFRWTTVEGAANYTFNLYEVVTQQGVDATVPIFSTTTNNTIIDYPALANLKNSTYQWNVVANDGKGGGSTSGNSTSPNNNFVYNVASGQFSASATSSVDGNSVTGANIIARATSGGVTPTNPFFLQSGSIEETLVTGVYEFTAEKEGFSSNTVSATIREGATTPVRLQLTPLPSFFTGTAQDQNGDPVDDAIVQLTDNTSGEVIEGTTDSQGLFGLYADAGSYVFTITKAGYISPASESVRLLQNDQRELENPVVMTRDQATLSGYVVNENGNPISLARVIATRASDGVVQEARTLDNGFYQFTLSSGNWTINAEKTGFVVDAALRISITGGDVLSNQNLRMNGRANQVTGFAREIIQNEDGSTGFAPLENVRITATPSSGSAVTVLTRRNGQYTLNLKRGSYTLTASLDRYRSETSLELVLGNGETVSGLNFELSPNPSSVSGLARRPDGTLLRDVTVTVTGVGQMVTSSDGAFRISVPAGSHVVTASRAGFVQPASQTVTVSAGQDLTGLSFSLFPNASVVQGTITARGEAVVAAAVRATPASGGTPTSVTTNNFGEYTLNLNPGTYTIQTFKNGFLDSDATEVVLSAGQTLRGVNQRLVSNTVTLRGAVVGSGAPLRDVTIAVTSSSREGFRETTRTLVNGTFALNVEAGHAYQVNASIAGYRSASDTTATLVAGEEPSAVNITLNPAPAQLSGRVTDPSGLALARATLSLVRSDGTVAETATSGNDGRYTMASATGEYTLRISLPGYLGADKNLNIGPGQNLTNVNFNMSENFAQLKGSILTETGDPVSNATIRLVSRSGGGGANTVTGETGIYTLGRLLQGGYTFSVFADGYLSVENVEVDLTAGVPTTLNQRLISASGLLGGVVQDVNGAIINEATITATDSEGRTLQTLTGSDGSFEISGIRPVTYVVQAVKAGYTLQQTDTVTLDDVSPVANDLVIDDLIRSIGQVRSSIVSDTNIPVAGAVFSMTGANGSASALTGSDGRFSIANLPLGVFNWTLTSTGFTSASGTFTLTESEPIQDLNLSIVENDGAIQGRVRDQSGAALPTPVEVRLLYNNELKTERTNAAGEFRFELLPKETEYVLETAVQGDGLNDGTLSFTFPAGQDVFTPESDLVVVFDNNIISGTVGIDNASVQLLSASGDLIDTKVSQADGSYRFRFIPAGNYKLTASRQGYVFNTDTVEIAALNYAETRTVDLSAQVNAGTIQLTVVDGSGAPARDVAVFLTDTDNTIVINRNTPETGLLVFTDLPAGKEYLISATKDGFTADPEQLTVSLGVGQNVSQTITMRANNASLSGTVRRTDTNGALASVVVQLINQQSGTTRQVTTNGSGVYAFNSIQSGGYTVISNVTGFLPDTLRDQQVASGENKVGVDLSLAPASLSNIGGKVVYKGAGLTGVTVTISGLTTVELTTDSNGDFNVANFPILTNDGDTTAVVATYSFGSFTESQILQIPASAAGSAISFPNVEIPSGSLNGLVTNGVTPIAGADITITRLSGTSVIQIETDQQGAFSTQENLRSGDYQLTVNTTNVLLPESSRNVTLASNSDQVESFFRLPYRFRSNVTVMATDSAVFKVAITAGYDAAGVSGELRYRKEQETVFSTVPFTKAGDTLYATMPPPGGVEPLTYQVVIQDDLNPEPFTSAESTVEPLPVNIVNAITLSPSPVGLLLRAGDQYPFSIRIRDGVNRSMTPEFVGDNADGSLELSAGSGALSVDTNGEVPTFNLLAPSESGTVTLNITARFNDQVFNRRINLQVEQVEIGAIQVSRPGRNISNAASAVFSYRAEASDGQQVLLGGSGQWSISSLSITAQNSEEESGGSAKLRGRNKLKSTDALGTITTDGIFTPRSNSIGQFSATYNDPNTGIVATSDAVSLVAQISDVDQTIELSNGEGFSMAIPSGSIQPNTQIRLSYRSPETPKKYVVAKGTDISLITSEEIFVVDYSGGQPTSPIGVTMPEPFDMGLNDGIRHVGYFNPFDLQWQLFSTNEVTDGYSSSEVDRMGQFAVLVENQPLGIEMVRVLPNPFSPMVAPVKIGYILHTDAPPAFVTIKIFNMRGQLIRTILDEDPQQPGRYGSQSSLKEITWDGLTDTGLMARNGRYVLQIVARDTKDQVETLNTIVLVK